MDDKIDCVQILSGRVKAASSRHHEPTHCRECPRETNFDTGSRRWCFHEAAILRSCSRDSYSTWNNGSRQQDVEKNEEQGCRVRSQRILHAEQNCEQKLLQNRVISCSLPAIFGSSVGHVLHYSERAPWATRLPAGKQRTLAAHEELVASPVAVRTKSRRACRRRLLQQLQGLLGLRQQSARR